MCKNYDVVVIGAGHAGVEAALAAARLNKKTLLLTLDLNKIASMPCNPSIGGPAKGIVVREIDALGGEMAKAADACSLQMKLLNSSRGPGVWVLRAQIDKLKYSEYMKNVVSSQNNLDVVENTVEHLIFKDSKIVGVKLSSNEEIFSKTVILTTGTYLDSLVFRGAETFKSGPEDQKTTSTISADLQKAGFKLLRFKTGTPARVKKESIDFSKANIELGTDAPIAFSFSTTKFTPIENQEVCWLIHSTPATQTVVETNITKSAMYSGKISSIGPRYCPSFEDKIMRFSDKPRHQIFLEPESLSLDTIYVQGFSTSMPIEVQAEMLKTLPGFENVVVDKWAYAIEYDCINPTQLNLSLESKIVENLFFAGQINGTSGYEEAAGQGLIAGINAVRKINNQSAIILSRDQAYIGVMIDDLINKGITEPYRLLTSRAEHRLLLRNDNAEDRLKKLGHQIGLIADTEYANYQNYAQKLVEITEFLKNTRFSPKSVLAKELIDTNQAVITQGLSALEIIKQPRVDIEILKKHIPELNQLTHNQLQAVIINIRFDGYIKKELAEVQRLNKLEQKLIPHNLDYSLVDNLAVEAKQKLQEIQPLSIGQALRISGVNPADIQMLLFHLKKIKQI